jgi:hypothetical protein
LLKSYLHQLILQLHTIFEEWNVREFKGKFHVEISKKDVFDLSFDFNIFYEWSNSIYDKFSYTNINISRHFIR